jgi:hypothetical protein
MKGCKDGAIYMLETDHTPSLKLKIRKLDG